MTRKELLNEIADFLESEYDYDREALDEEKWGDNRVIPLLFTEIYEDDVDELYAKHEEKNGDYRTLQISYDLECESVLVWYDDVLKFSIHFSYRELSEWLDWDSLYCLKDGIRQA